ncbi:hypothetical protein [Pseudobacteriovorax antillogorgiicola]|uniref:Uncharacterized protein n=1 Tax=Pseudobacteriovorax antillogorgiicola TaxID=1513793 RepID=A0A1Y6BG43_9BACT|nr:hypothetical protein [Pseudobacteriovorax antillogorgiicola]TCS57561.1 hypothetical protein EDD56_103301 [Pseudobacteriovorax antillogorgiicola]SME99772.1 hypothetical protein SAMN06296036_10332 [Pseudobacteriovorax antillogorgiicola]
MSRFILRNTAFTTIAIATLLIGPPLVQQCGSEELTGNSTNAEGVFTQINIPLVVQPQDELHPSIELSLKFRLVSCNSGASYDDINDAETEAVTVFESDQRCRVELYNVALQGVDLVALEPFTDFAEGDQATYATPTDDLIKFQVLSQLSSPVLPSDSVYYSFNMSFVDDPMEAPQDAEEVLSNESPNTTMPPEPEDPSVDEYLLVKEARIQIGQSEKTKVYDFYHYGRVWWIDSDNDSVADTCQTVANGLVILDHDLPVTAEYGYESASCYAINVSKEIDQSPWNPRGSQQQGRDLQSSFLKGIDINKIEGKQLKYFFQLVRKSEQLYRKFSRLLRKQAEILALKSEITSQKSYSELRKMTGHQRKSLGFESDYRIYKRIDRLEKRCARIKAAIQKNMDRANRLRHKLGADFLVADAIL